MAVGVGRVWVLLTLGLLLGTAQENLVSVEAWGADGHHITCLLAEPLLTPAALAGVRSLLPEYANGSLASLCTWADDIKWMWKWEWTSPLHYIDTPDFYCNYNYARDCHNEMGQQDMCVAGGINNYSSQLLTYHASGSALGPHDSVKAGYNLTEALLFLAHYMGDIHQPLHVAFTSDAGGNTIILHWYTSKYNLHHIWDTEFIARARDHLYGSDLSAFTDALYQNITTAWLKDTWLKDTADWAKCPDGALVCPDLIADESIILAYKWAYRNATPGTTLQDDYFYSRLPIVNQQLAKGGVRLAAILNRIFSKESAPADL